MTEWRRKYFLMVISVAVGMIVWGSSPAMAELKCQVFCPNFVSGLTTNITVTAINEGSVSLTFNKVAIAYINPDLTVKGPYVKAISRTVAPHSSTTFTVPIVITSTQPAGTLVPVIVTLWQNYITKGYERGAGAGAAMKNQ